MCIIFGVYGAYTVSERRIRDAPHIIRRRVKPEGLSSRPDVTDFMELIETQYLSMKENRVPRKARRKVLDLAVHMYSQKEYTLHQIGQAFKYLDSLPPEHLARDAGNALHILENNKDVAYVDLVHVIEGTSFGRNSRKLGT